MSTPSPEFQQQVRERRHNRMKQIDRLDPKIRALVHEYGYTVIKAFLDVGVTKPNRIRHLIETTLDEMLPTRGSFSSQGSTATRHK